MLVRRIEIEKQKLVELPHVVEITPVKSEQPQLLVIEIRLPDRHTKSFNSHYIPYSWTPSQSSRSEGSCATPSQTTQQQAIPYPNIHLAPFQGAISASTQSPPANFIPPSVFHEKNQLVRPVQTLNFNLQPPAASSSSPVQPSSAPIRPSNQLPPSSEFRGPTNQATLSGSIVPNAVVHNLPETPLPATPIAATHKPQKMYPITGPFFPFSLEDSSDNEQPLPGRFPPFTEPIAPANQASPMASFQPNQRPTVPLFPLFPSPNAPANHAPSNTPFVPISSNTPSFGNMFTNPDPDTLDNRIQPNVLKSSVG